MSNNTSIHPDLDRTVASILEEAERNAKDLFAAIDKIAEVNQKKVIDAFRTCKVSARHFVPTTGYGYDDEGRDCLQRVFAEVFGAERAIVSPNLVSGTHTLTVALFGLLKTGDRMLCISGAPYDTLCKVISGVGNGSLADYGIGYDQIDILADGTFDFDAIDRFLQKNKPKLVFLTRSRGYSWRNALSIEAIGQAVRFVKDRHPDCLVAVDNCYGEFVATQEPLAVGADIIIGSLIKNPGGGLAPTGGYIAGKADAVEQISYRLTSPSIGSEVGSYFAPYLPFYQGLFFAPNVVAGALKGSILAGFAFHALGYDVSPTPAEMPGDIIRAIRFRTAEELIAYVQGVQYASPVDSYVTPEPWDMPGYQDPVIMAAGTFVQGASIELSADSPIKEPYIAYLQGGLTYQHCKIAVAECLKRILSNR